jgi:spore germination protein YaaH
MDYAALARYADRLVVLSYSPHPGSAERVAPADWAARVASYAINEGVPKSKLGIAFSLKGEGLEGLSDKVEGLRKGLGLRIFSFWNLETGNQSIWEWIAQKPPGQKRKGTSRGEAVAARAKGEK